MVENLYAQGWQQRKVATGPLFQYYEPFLRHMVAKGYTLPKLKKKLRIINFLSQHLKRKGIPVERLNQHEIKRFVRMRAPGKGETPSGDIFTLQHFLEFLAENNAIPKWDDRYKRRQPSKTDRLLEEFGEHLVTNRGLSHGCVRRYKQLARNLIKYSSKRGLTLRSLTFDQVHNYILQNAKQSTSSVSKNEVTALRHFFKFLFMTGKTKTNLGPSLLSVVHREGTPVPEVLDEEEVKKILDSIDRSTSVGKRNFVLVLLMARYGFRGKDVIRLKMSDIHWESSTIKLFSSKTKKTTYYPLMNGVGEAIADYIKHGRPKTEDPHLILTVKEPFTHVASTASVVQVVHKIFDDVGISPGKRVSHRFRYTAASRVLKNDGSLQDVAELLGHDHINTAAVYTKLDIPRLRKIARVWPLSEGFLYG